MTTTKKLLYSYHNLDSFVQIYEDGTKVRQSVGNRMIQPESIDLKITNQCNRKCSFCAENSCPTGLHANYETVLDLVDCLAPGTEIAIGGGNALLFPELKYLLNLFHSKGLISNLTVHETDFVEKIDEIRNYMSSGLIMGLGVSASASYFFPNQGFSPEVGCLIKTLPYPQNVVIHLIAGLSTIEQILSFSDYGYKVLVLGYKKLGRGKAFYNDESENTNSTITDLKNKIPFLLNNAKNIISFDNLAIKQLDVMRWLKHEGMQDLYMGEDGKYSMFVDAVEMKYAKSSCHKRLPIPEKTNIMQLYQKMNGW